eukprot:3973951-Amphidinium_carterae.1
MHHGTMRLGSKHWFNEVCQKTQLVVIAAGGPVVVGHEALRGVPHSNTWSRVVIQDLEWKKLSKYPNQSAAVVCFEATEAYHA